MITAIPKGDGLAVRLEEALPSIQVWVVHASPRDKLDGRLELYNHVGNAQRELISSDSTAEYVVVVLENVKKHEAQQERRPSLSTL